MRIHPNSTFPSKRLADTSLGPEARVLSGRPLSQLAWSVLEECTGTLSFRAHLSPFPGFRIVLRRSRFLYFLGVSVADPFVQLSPRFSVLEAVCTVGQYSFSRAGHPQQVVQCGTLLDEGKHLLDFL